MPDSRTVRRQFQVDQGGLNSPVAQPPAEVVQRNPVEQHVPGFPDYAMGLRLGEGLCGELAVIDVNHPEELTDHQQGVIEGWPWLVATHRGLHAYGRPSGQWVKSVKQLPWGDYLAHGSFVVGPGNAHRDGGRYMTMPGWGVGPGLRTPGVRPATVPA